MATQATGGGGTPQNHGSGIFPAIPGGGGTVGNPTPRPSNGATPSPSTHQLTGFEAIDGYPETFGQALFAMGVLAELGIPPTHGAVAGFVGWEKAEGGNWHNTAKRNPLNTRERMPGDTLSANGFPAYKSWADGVTATARTLKQSNMAGIRAALRTGDQRKIATAIGASPWGTHDLGPITGEKWSDVQSSWVKGINPNDPFNPQNVPADAVNAAKNVVKAVESIPQTIADAWHTLSSGTFWLRVGMILLGMVALGMGAAMIAKTYVPQGIQTAVRKGVSK